MRRAKGPLWWAIMKHMARATIDRSVASVLVEAGVPVYQQYATDPAPETWAKVAHVFGVSVDELKGVK